MKKEAAVNIIKAHFEGKPSRISNKILGEIIEKLTAFGAFPPFSIERIKIADYTSEYNQINSQNEGEANFLDQVNDAIASSGAQMLGQMDPSTGELTIFGMPLQAEGIISITNINDKAQNSLIEISKTEAPNGLINGTISFVQEENDNPAERKVTFRVDDTMRSRFDPITQEQMDGLEGVVRFPQIQEEIEAEGEQYGEGEITIQ
jgi:hypothetical protein